MNKCYAISGDESWTEWSREKGLLSFASWEEVADYGKDCVAYGLSEEDIACIEGCGFEVVRLTFPLRYECIKERGKWRVYYEGEVATRGGKEIDGGGYYEKEVVQRKVNSLNGALTIRRRRSGA